MRHLAVVALGLVAVAGPRGAAAQVSAPSQAFQLVRLEREGDLYVYMYRLLGPAKVTETFADVYLDVGIPKHGTDLPRLLGVRGPFVGDGVVTNFAAVERTHPPLWVGTPGNWPAAIYYNAVVSWGASRYGNGTGWNAGVRAGEQLGGFELRSPGIPMMRRWRVAPLRAIGDADERALPARKDTSWVMREGVVLGPGEEPAHITTATLGDQLRLATTGYLLDTPGQYLRLLDLIRQAETQRNDLLYQGALRRFQQLLAADRVSLAMARTVLGAICDALATRPPSAR